MSRLPSLKSKEVIRALKRASFFIERQTGSHIIMISYNWPYPVTVPYHNRDLNRNTLIRIIKGAGLSIDDFIKLL